MSITTNCIDVSTWNTGIDWNKVKNAGIKAVIIRAGFGRELSQKDTQLENHYRGAKNAGLKIGIYWYSYADSVADAKREAQTCLAIIKGKSIDLPIYYDMEESSMTKLGRSTLTAMAKAFCEAIKSAGYKAGVYANPNWFGNFLDYNDLKSRYSIWLAQWGVSKNSYACDIWQYADNGKISGVSGNCDVNTILNPSILDGDTPERIRPTISYCACVNGKWGNTVKGYSGNVGDGKNPITAIAIKVAEGAVRYRVHTTQGKWLNWITGYSTSDTTKYAGNGTPIDAIQVEYFTPDRIVKANGGYLKAKYKVAPIGKDYYSTQYDLEVSSMQDGYAGSFGKPVGRFMLTLD